MVLLIWVSYKRLTQGIVCFPRFWLNRNGITLHMFLCDLLLSFKIMFLRFIHLMCSHRCFQLAPNSLSSLYMILIQKQTRFYFLSHQLALPVGIQQCMAISQLIYIWCGLVPSFCRINSAAVNMADLVCWHARAKVYPENAPRQGTAGSRVCECSAVRGNATCFFQKWLKWSTFHLQ